MYGVGDNSNYQLFLSKNEKISLPEKITFIDPLKIVDFSIGFCHSVYITNEGKAFAIGRNEDFNIGLPEKEFFQKPVEVKFQSLDPDEKFVKAHCGQIYTIYLTNKNTIIYCTQYTRNREPIFVRDIETPIKLTGNLEFPIVIDIEGAFYIFGKNKKAIKRKIVLPEPIIDVVLLRKEFRVFAVSKNGNIFTNGTSQEDQSIFSKVTYLNAKIIQVSGVYEHCIAISEDGRVFSIGSNNHGQLGNSNMEKIEVFTQMTALKNLFFCHAASGYYFTHLLTKEGKVYTIGNNICSDAHVNKNLVPISYIVAGAYSSVLFKNWKPTNLELKKCLMTLPKLSIHDNSITFMNDKYNRLQQKIGYLRRSYTEKSQQYAEENLKFHEVKAKIELLKTTDIMSSSLVELNEKIDQLSSSTINLEAMNRSIRSQNELLKERLKSTEPENSFQLPDLLGSEQLDEYQVICEIGSGGFARVDKVVHKQSGNIYAMKTLYSRPTQDDLLSRFIGEYEFLLGMPHPCIVPVRGFSYGDGRTCNPTMLMEYLPKTLAAALNEGILTSTRKCLIVLEIALGMRFIHSFQVMHRDLKPENVLLTESLHAKICDFGLAKKDESDNDQGMQDKRNQHTTDLGTLLYMAPELLNKQPYNKLIDVYSFGVCTYVILVGDKPNISIFDRAKGEQIEMPSDLPEVTQNLLKKMMAFDPEDRPSFEEIYQIMASINFKLLDDAEESFIIEKANEIIVFEMNRPEDF
ncbi:hypothetical protein TRFO_15546 [Tritrichomonas foetus]|uniref:Protein kinase domain-containing protein n=1 Tax=Tritrichomonas foetus TaxID=1144522 RepID=A0A1J4KS09_9EUKA|nr:hypothetical protein TRFO_15546 [Tritrichomonas foetus]|eukprot:OHT14051.1 hypothetical protein TRFO_15546 [Tritrichomonas foetus]